MKKITIILVIYLLAGCAQTSKKEAALSPIKAIELSNQSAPQSVNGVFEMTVKAANIKQRMAFLNSEKDHKDQRNLIVALRPNAIQELTERYGAEPQDFFYGKQIRVSGEAKRIKVWNRFKHRNLGSYHYQTQIFVHKADQIVLR